MKFAFLLAFLGLIEVISREIRIPYKINDHDEMIGEVCFSHLYCMSMLLVTFPCPMIISSDELHRMKGFRNLNIPYQQFIGYSNEVFVKGYIGEGNFRLDDTNVDIPLKVIESNEIIGLNSKVDGILSISSLLPELGNKHSFIWSIYEQANYENIYIDIVFSSNFIRISSESEGAISLNFNMDYNKSLLDKSRGSVNFNLKGEEVVEFPVVFDISRKYTTLPFFYKNALRKVYNDNSDELYKIGNNRFFTLKDHSYVNKSVEMTINIDKLKFESSVVMYDNIDLTKANLSTLSYHYENYISIGRSIINNNRILFHIDGGIPGLSVINKHSKTSNSYGKIIFYILSVVLLVFFSFYLRKVIQNLFSNLLIHFTEIKTTDYSNISPQHKYL